MKFISWNVNGIRACVTKGFLDYFKEVDADIFCLQETKLQDRMKWEDDFREYLKNLDNIKPVIVCGDLNVAHKEIDLKNPKTNRKNAGFTDEEREKLTTLLNNGFIDTYRYFNPNKEGIYSWWSYRFNARKNNSGWRIDYF